MGRSTGKLVGLTADVKDEVTALQVASSSGEVAEYPINSVRIINGHPILLQAWRVEAEDLKREHSIIKRRRQALDLLLKDGEDRKSTRLNSSHSDRSRMPSSA